MALVAARGSISVLSTDTVGTTKTVSGLSFQPKLIFFMVNGRTDATDAAGGASHRRCFGAATGTADRRAVTNTALDAAAAADGGAYHTNTACIVQVSATGGAVDGLMDVNAINSDGFQLIVDDQFPNDVRIHWMAIGDTAGDITNVVTFQFQAPGTTGAQSQDITSLAFQPTALLLFNIGSATAPPSGVSTNIQMAMGAATAAADDHVWHGCTDEASTTMDTQGYCRAGEIVVFNDGTGGKTLNGRAEFTQFLSNGFRLNWLEHATINRYVFGVAIKGPQVAVFNSATRTDGNDIVVSGLAFQPRACIILSAGRAQSTADTPTAGDRWSCGFGISASDRGALAVYDRDAVADAQIVTAVEYDEVYVHFSDADAIDGLMDIKSVDSGGYTFVMDDADPSASFFFGIAFGDAPAAGGVTYPELERVGRGVARGVLTGGR